MAAGMSLWRDQDVNQFLAVWLNNSAWHPLNRKNDLEKKKGTSLCVLRTGVEKCSFRPYLIEYYPREHLVIQFEKENASSGGNPLFWSPAVLSNSPSLQLLFLERGRCQRKYCFQGRQRSFSPLPSHLTKCIVITFMKCVSLNWTLCSPPSL